MRRTAIGILLLASLLVVPAQGEEPVGLDGDAQRLGYSIGFQVGSDFRRTPASLDPDLVVEGLLHALEGTTPRLTSAEMREALRALEEATRGDGAPAESVTPTP